MTFRHLRQEKSQTSLGICIVWSESPLGELGIVQDVTILHADNLDFYKTDAQDDEFCWAHVCDGTFSEVEAHKYNNTPRPLYNTIVGVHSINRVS